VSTNVFLGVKFCENEKKRKRIAKIHSQYSFFFFYEKNPQISKKRRILSHLKFNFSLLAFFKLKFSLH